MMSRSSSNSGLRWRSTGVPMTTITVSVSEIVEGSSERTSFPPASVRRSTGSAPCSWKGSCPSPMMRSARSSMSSAQTLHPLSASEIARGRPTRPNPPTMTTSYFIFFSILERGSFSRIQPFANERERIVDDEVELVFRVPAEYAGGLFRGADPISNVRRRHGHVPEPGECRAGIDARPDPAGELTYSQGVVATEVEVVIPQSLLQHHPQSVCDILRVCEGAHLLAISEDLERRLPDHRLVDEIRNDVSHAEGYASVRGHVRQLASADCVEWPDDQIVEPHLLVRTARQEFTEQLLHTVVREGHGLCEGVFFRNGPLHALINHRAGEVHEDGLRARGQRTIDSVRKKLGVVPGDPVRDFVEVFDAADQRRQAEDHVEPLVLDRVHLSDVLVDEMKPWVIVEVVFQVA